METCPSSIPVMRASITPSLTPLWRSKAFPQTADLAAHNATDGEQAPSATQHLHRFASLPSHEVATKSLLALPSQRAGTQGHSEHETRLLEELSWISQAADGTQGAHLLHAQEAVAHVKGLLRNGSNALHDAQVPAHKALELSEKTYYCLNKPVLEAANKGQIPAKVETRADGRRVTKVALAHYAMYAEPAIRFIGFGNCTLQACAAYSYLKRHLPPNTPVDLCEVRGADHVLVVIGRRPGSDPNNMDDWGPQAVVCDPWAGITYPLSQYREMQKPERDVKRHIGASNGHYLNGGLQVLTAPVELG